MATASADSVYAAGLPCDSGNIGEYILIVGIQNGCPGEILPSTHCLENSEVSSRNGSGKGEFEDARWGFSSLTEALLNTN